MELFASKDEKIHNLEKKLGDLERKIDRNFAQMDESFNAFKRIVLNMQVENKELAKDRDFLIERYKEVLRKMPGIQPIKQAVQDTSNLVRDIVLQDLDIEPKKKNIDDLFELVMKRKKISAKAAARELDVTEDRVKYMADKLEKNNLIQITEKSGKIDLVKK